MLRWTLLISCILGRCLGSKYCTSWKAIWSTRVYTLVLVGCVNRVCFFSPKTVDHSPKSLLPPFFMLLGGTKPTDARDAKPNVRASQWQQASGAITCHIICDKHQEAPTYHSMLQWSWSVLLQKVGQNSGLQRRFAELAGNQPKSPRNVGGQSQGMMEQWGTTDDRGEFRGELGGCFLKCHAATMWFSNEIGGRTSRKIYIFSLAPVAA